MGSGLCRACVALQGLYTQWSSLVSRSWLYIFVSLGLIENRSKKNACWSESRLVSSLQKLSTARDYTAASGPSDVQLRRSFICMICNWMLCKITGCDASLEEPGAESLVLHFHGCKELSFLSDTSETESICNGMEDVKEVWRLDKEVALRRAKHLCLFAQLLMEGEVEGVCEPGGRCLSSTWELTLTSSIYIESSSPLCPTAFKAPVLLLLTSVVLPWLSAIRVAKSLSTDNNLSIVSMFISVGGEARHGANTWPPCGTASGRIWSIRGRNFQPRFLNGFRCFIGLKMWSEKKNTEKVVLTPPSRCSCQTFSPLAWYHTHPYYPNAPLISLSRHQ